MTNRPNSESDSGSQGVKSISTLFSILEHIKENDEVGVTELATELDMSKGAVHRYLNTLVKEDYAINQGGSYQLSMKFLDLGTYVRDRYPFTEYIKPKVHQLAEETGERAQYIIEQHGRGIYLYREQGQNAVQTDVRVGKVVDLHTTAAGKAILSQLSPERVNEIVGEKGLTERTNQTITDRVELQEELAEIRERGYSLNKEEHISGLYAVGVPITNQNGEVLGGLSVSGPINRIEDRVESGKIQKILLGIENEVELNLSYS